jgi:methionyl-tRNA synthetase
MERFIQRYNSDLANDLGNLLNRIINMIDIYFEGLVPSYGEMEPTDALLKNELLGLVNRVDYFIERFELHNILRDIWRVINIVNTYLEKTSPWGLAKAKRYVRLQTVLYNAAQSLRIIAILVFPFIPAKAQEIWTQIGLGDLEKLEDVRLDSAKNWDYIKAGSRVKKGKPIFPRIQNE